jgi:hypothetical protein
LLFAEQDFEIPPALEEVQPTAAGDVGRVDERAIRSVRLFERACRRVEL